MGEMCCSGLCNAEECLCDPRYCDASDDCDGWEDETNDH